MANGLFNLKQQLQGLIRGAWSGTSSSNAPKYLEYLVVAGGGGASAGGGGAGGLLQGLSPITLGASYTVTVGVGGTSGTGNGTNGTNSVFSNITALGGGGGGWRSVTSALSGGSGGGSNADNAGAGGQGTFGQGNSGGNNPNSYNRGGGGGGAGTVGSAPSAAGVDSVGGSGIASGISGVLTVYAAGGAGTATAANGSANTGNGAIGSYGSPSGNGGSGIVIVRYAGTTQYFTGGTLSYANGFVSHTFYASGTLAPLATPTTYANFSYAITKSLRFRASNTAYLSRTPGSAGSRTTWTFSVWLKRGVLTGPTKEIFTASSGGEIYFGPDSLTFYDNSTSYFTTSQIFQDPSAWYHIVIVWDTTQATSSNRIKVYVNGTRVTSFAATNYPAQNTTSSFNNNTLHYIGEYFGGGSYYYDGEMAEINFIDGQALTPLSFGATSPTTGVWQPIAFVGTYGTNGFYLPFTNTTSTTTLGYDSSGNGNNWTTNNFSLTAGSTYDSMTDSPTLTSATNSNYAVLNPLNSYSSGVSNGNLKFSDGSGSGYQTYGTMANPEIASYNFYCEVTVDAGYAVGIAPATKQGGNSSTDRTSALTYYSNGSKFNGTTSSSYGATFTNGDVIGIAMGGGSVTFYKNGTSQGSAFTGLTGAYIFGAWAAGGAGNGTQWNFGQQPFTYTPPSGYVALNTYNLPTPAIANGALYMDATTYNGLGSSNAVVMNAGQFQPDFVWVKSRSNITNHQLFDSVRGASAGLNSNSTNAEANYGMLPAFNSNGFTAGGGASYDGTNYGGYTYVAWQWQAGKGTTSSNTNGSITSTVSVNTTAGFSIVTWTYNGSGTIGHGLGAVPQMIIQKDRTSGTYNWDVYHVSLGNTKRLILNSSAAADVENVWNNTTPTSSVFSIGSSWYTNGDAIVSYCFAPIAGFSAFGSFTGNSSATGPFVYCGFQPKYVIMKRTDGGTNSWFIWDTARVKYNTNGEYLLAYLSDSAVAFPAVNMLSNGFQLATTSTDINGSGNTYIYMAFASNPFKYANAF